MKVTVNKCPDTGKLIEDDNEYKNYRAMVIREKNKKAQIQTTRDTFWAWLAAEKLKITSPDMIGPWFLENQRKIMDAVNAGLVSKGGWSGFNDRFVPDDVFTKCELKFQEYTHSVSNTHSCPDSGETNFMCDDSKPRGYPGWVGRIDGVLVRPPKKDYEYPYSSAINLVGIKTGSGGGGNSGWDYDVRIFLDDWPGLVPHRDTIVAERERIAYEKEQERIIWRLKNAGGKR
jgi:hypothetical protein